MSDPEQHTGRRLSGRRPGDHRVRVKRPHAPYFRYSGARTLVARPAASRPRTPSGRSLAAWGRVFGRPLSWDEESSQRLNVATGLPVFASDNISSSAYATEEIMRVLAFAGAGALVLTLPITLVVVVVLAILQTSYRQTIAAYPKGGGSYIVASDNLGTLPGLTAASAILTDYVLTVAVSIAAGVAALTSIFPVLFDMRVLVGVVLVLDAGARQPARHARERFGLQRADIHLPRLDLRTAGLRPVPLRHGHNAQLHATARAGSAQEATKPDSACCSSCVPLPPDRWR